MIPSSQDHMVKVCPYCLYTIGKDSCCKGPNHHKIVESDWSRFPKALLQRHLSPPSNPDSPFEIPVPMGGHQGRVYSGLPHSLSSQDNLSIGSDRNCDIVIDGIEETHAVIFRKFEGAGFSHWICHIGSADVATIVNGDVVSTTQIHAGDVITIAGIHILYNGNELLVDERKSTGVRITVKELSALKPNGSPLLRKVSFQVKEGEFVGILGPSGCGKSTLIQRLVRLSDYTGSVHYNGRSLEEEAEYILKGVSYIPQNSETVLHPDLTVLEEVGFYAKCRFRNMPEDVLKDLGLDGRRYSKVGHLSGGEKKRLAIALEFMRLPGAMLLDEPTAGLDLAASSTVMNLLKDISKRGTTILCATHILEEMELFDKILVMAPGGVVCYYGAPKKALKSFGVKSWLELYKNLSEGRENGFKKSIEPFSIDTSKRELPEPPAPCSFWKSVLHGYLGRLFKENLQGKKIANVLINPLLLSILVPFACSSRNEIDTFCFCSVISAFWMGLSGSVRNLASERIPGRCLERLAGLPLRRYLTAHLINSTLIALIQNGIFAFGLLIASAHFNIDKFCNVLNSSPATILPMILVLAAVGLVGATIGHTVSAISKNETQALIWLPLAALAALLISKPVLNDCWLLFCMPTYYPQELLKGIAEGGMSYAWKFTGATLIWLALSISLTPSFQDVREKSWNGRN